MNLETIKTLAKFERKIKCLSPEDRQVMGLNEWVTSLLWPDLKQAQGMLYDSDEASYCCLGVHCEFVLHATFMEEEEEWDSLLGRVETPAMFLWMDHDIENSGYLPSPVVPLLLQHILSEANDEGVSFPVIAGWLQKYCTHVPLA